MIPLYSTTARRSATDSTRFETMSEPLNFIRQAIEADLKSGRHDEVVTRFPPEPNGYLHIGHAKSIWLNFKIAEDCNGRCTLRFDDTNPAKEEREFVKAIEEDVRWLGFQWSEITHTSDYFDQLHRFAIELIGKGLAYVDSLSAEQIKQYRGALSEPGRDSPFRERPVQENLDLFERMRLGEFAQGEHVLRAKIDMAAPNMNLRDPVIYRILHHAHQRTGDKWCIYPLYDFAHGQGDAIEGVTHSLCTLEFEDHRALYNWFLDNLSVPGHPRQIEFSRLNLDYTVMSKRMLTRLVENGHVDDWDDPRMPTLSGLRRRGYTPQAIRNFISSVGITKRDNMIGIGVLENSIRENLDPIAPRVMTVLEPLRVIIENYPCGQSEEIEAPSHPHNEAMGKRKIRLSREIFIERNDFMEEPPKGFYRLAPRRKVRLRYAFVIYCKEVIRDGNGEITQLLCEYDPHTRHGKQPASGKVKGIIHWVSAHHCVDGEVRLYDRLFSKADPLADKSRDFTETINPDSLQVLTNCKFDPILAKADGDMRYQFERLGYFYADKEHSATQPVYNRIVTLRDTWAKLQRQTGTKP